MTTLTTLLFLCAFVNMTFAQTTCSYKNRPGVCNQESECTGDWTGWEEGDGKCRPLPAGIKCCTPKPTTTVSATTSLSSTTAAANPTDNVASTNVNPSTEPTPSTSTTTSVTAAPTEPPSSDDICTYDGRSGVCAAACPNGELTAWNAPNAGGECRPKPAGIQCCTPPAPPPVDEPLMATGPACDYAGIRGVCIDHTDCIGHDQGVKRTAFRSSQGANGCGHIKEAAVRCCVAAPANLVVPGFGVPNGRACALARPGRGCSAYTGSKLTINIKFADEAVRIHAHARNSGSTIYVTSSFRPLGTKVGASRSRHQIGFAFDFNVAGCNALCMCPYPNVRNSRARNFLQRVVGDSTLHWGGDPRKPIWWAVGGCRRDSVHVQSTKYEDGGRYDSVRTCLNSEYRASRFLSFDCTTGAALYDDKVFEEDVENAAPDALGGGAIFGIVLAALICVGLVVLLVVVARKRSATSGNLRVADESGTAATIHMTPSAEIGTGYTCAQCGNDYATAEELAAHVELRH